MMDKIVFSSMTSERDKRFQICTKIIDRKGRLYVRKEALNNESRSHIDDIVSNEKTLNETYKNCRLFKTAKVLGKGDDWVEFAYLDEISLDKYLESFDDKEKYELLSGFWNELLNCKICNKKISSVYKHIFGNYLADVKHLHWSENQNIDLSLSNIYLRNKKYIVSDFEWVFSFAVPLEFIFFRSIFYSNALSDKHKYYQIAGISEGELDKYIDTENCFQQYVRGNTVSLWEHFDRFSKGYENWNIIDLRTKEKQEREDNNRLNSEIKDKNIQIKQKDIEIETVRQELLNKDKEIKEKDEQIERLSYIYKELNEIKQSAFVKAMYSWYRFRDKALPEGSRRRVFVKAFVEIIKHPVKTIGSLNPQRIGKFFIFLINGDVNKIAQKIEDVTESDFERMKLDVSLSNDYTRLHFKENNNPLVSIVIPVFNQFDYTYHCLESILKHCHDVSYEIIIGDDKSDDQTVKINEYTDNIRIIRNNENLGFLKNCNNAAGYAKGKYIVFLNNDTQVQDKWLDSLLDLIESDETIGMVGSKLVYPDGSLQEAGGIIWSDGSGWNYGRNKSPLESEYNYVKDVDYISGASIVIRRDLWNMIGGFDERYAPAYCEDSDLAFNIRKQGYRVVYQPLSVVVHFEGISNGTDLNSGQKQYQLINKEKFIEKWQNELKNQYHSEKNVFKARERGRNKKTIVIIDHYVPQYDKDAGSKTTIQYIGLFLKHDFSVKFIPDNFYQDEPYTTVLQQMGVEVLYGEKYAKHIFDWIKENESYIDYIYLNRPHISIKYIDFIKNKTNIKTIYYGHDLHFLRTEREYELNHSSETLDEIEKWKKQEFHILKNTDMNYYPSEIEVKTIHEIDKGIPVKAIVPYIYNDIDEIRKYEADKRKGLLFVGGFTHKPNYDGIMWFINDVFPKLSDEARKLVVVGSNAPDDLLNMKLDGIDIKGFVSEEELQDLYSRSRLAVVPLRYGAGIKGKIIEAIYNGVPVVTTSVGAEGIVEAEKIMFISDDAEEMAYIINRIIGDNKLLQSKSRQGRKYISDHFSSEAAWKRIKDDFN